MELSPWLILLFFVNVQAYAVLTNLQDTASLEVIADSWSKKPSSWVGDNPCQDNWTGIVCNGSRVTSIRLSGILSGLLEEPWTLSGEIMSLTELQELDLSQNKNLFGQLPPSIGYLRSLQFLILSGCNFSGEIPKVIGQLSELTMLYLNSNNFEGPIPPSLGNLSKLSWLDLADNKLTGELPVFDGTNPGLDNLTNTLHFHFGINKLSGTIPSQIFNSNMKLIHLLLDNNNFSGSIPPTLGLLNKMEVIRLDNNKLTGPVSTTISNLNILFELQLANNRLTGPLPDLTGMRSLMVVDMSNNNFSASDAPSWFTTLLILTSLTLENLGIGGQLPRAVFSLPEIQTLRFQGNHFNETLAIGPNVSTHLQLIDLRDNQITDTTSGVSQYNEELILSGNPGCNQGIDPKYCTPNLTTTTSPSYTTATDCPSPPPTCLSSQLLSPSCFCATPYSGKLSFRALKFSDLSNSSYFLGLEKTMVDTFLQSNISVSVALHDLSINVVNNLEISLEIFPRSKTQFGEQDISEIGFILNRHKFKPPSSFGPYFFIAQTYSFASEMGPSKQKTNRAPLIVGISVGAAVAMVLVLVIAITIRKRKPKQSEERSQTSVSWDVKSTSTSVPQPRSARMFTFKELKKITDNFSEANVIGNGGFGKVYRGTLPGGQMVAIKRAQQDSLQGSLEFRTEIELLSRVHHKNVVAILGFCLDQGEQMLVYEYIANGTLKQSLTGKSGIRLDWKRRLGVVLGVAKGVAYLHEHADPPIVHRDIKSSNVLLGERLNAKVSDFGLSKPLGCGDGRGHVTTQVKGTMVRMTTAVQSATLILRYLYIMLICYAYLAFQGYLDPEYYMTQQLTEKSDVYGFGVLLLEVITARTPMERGRYVVREVRAVVDWGKDLYGLHELLDPVLAASSPSLVGLEQYVDLALHCVEEAGVDRPPMAEVVGEIERIMKMAAAAVSGSDTVSYASRTPSHPYGVETSSDYSGRRGLPSSRVEPK
ncbi:unnamed protein product [Alopecurus aequalis]